MNGVATVIITYNIGERFRNTILKLKGKTEEIIVVDNGSKDFTINMLESLKEEITLIKLKENKGIAYALNRGIEYAINKGYKWILTLDHDSIIEDSMIKNMLKCYENLEAKDKEKVAMLVPKHIEENQFNEECLINKLDEGYNEVITEITSGALVKAKIYKEFGMYDERLFIDLVDHDYCLSLNQHKYKIIQVNSAILIHNLGESTPRKVFGLKVTCTNHSPIRRYYMTRNRLYIWAKYKNQFPKWVKLDKKRFLSEIIKIILFENNKFTKIRFIAKGIKDYKNKKIGAINIEK